MATQTQGAERFVRKTRLGPYEYRKNFRQIDSEIIAVVTSVEADAVTPLMSKIYLRLTNSSEGNWEREGVLRFAGGEADGRWVTAWEQLVALSGVSSATARKAFRWMHTQGVVGYFAGKNGVGIRIFLNRAASSIGRRSAPGQKNLRLVPASTEAPRASANDTPFSDSFADLEVSETDLSPHAPKIGAGTLAVGKPSPAPPPTLPPSSVATRVTTWESNETAVAGATAVGVSVEEIVSCLKADLEPRVTEVAARAAARTAQREMESTREWFERKALPKAVRVAQRETYDLMRKQGLAGEGPGRSHADSEVGRRREPVVAPAARPLTDVEVRETAEMCAALLEAQGKPVEATLAEISAEGGGWLLAEDVPRVRAEVESILHAGKGEVRLGDGR